MSTVFFNIPGILTNLLIFCKKNIKNQHQQNPNTDVCFFPTFTFIKHHPIKHTLTFTNTWINTSYKHLCGPPGQAGRRLQYSGRNHRPTPGRAGGYLPGRGELWDTSPALQAGRFPAPHRLAPLRGGAPGQPPAEGPVTPRHAPGRPARLSPDRSPVRAGPVTG